MAVRVEGGVDLGSQEPSEQPPVEAHVSPEQSHEHGGHEADHVAVIKLRLVQGQALEEELQRGSLDQD